MAIVNHHFKLCKLMYIVLCLTSGYFIISDNYIVTVLLVAIQMWCLARMLPLLIGDLSPQDESHWENFLLLLKIEILFAPTSRELAAYLAVLIEEYLENFSKLYTRSIIPKQHYMVHYPRQIVR